MVYRAYIVDRKRLTGETCQPIIHTSLDYWKRFLFWTIAGYPYIMIFFVTNEQTPNEQQKSETYAIRKRAQSA